MKRLLEFLEYSYTPYHAVENAKKLLEERGFSPLYEQEPWKLTEGGKYYVTRNGSSLIAFTLGAENCFKVIASHTDSPCFKVKENPVVEGAGGKRLNVEPYGGSLYYSFFDRPLRLAGRLVKEKDGVLKAETYCSDFSVVIPSLAIHQNREANEKFAPNAQIDLLPLYSLAEKAEIFADCVSYDAYAVCDQKPFICGANGELICSPRVDNLTSVLASLEAVTAGGTGVCVAACLDSEEVGSHTYQGAGGDFLRAVLTRIATAKNMTEEELFRAIPSSLCISLDNAHAVHPAHPEKSDVTNQAKLGGGAVIKAHAGKAYATDGITSAIIKKIFEGANAPYQFFYNRSDVKSGSTLGAISLGQITIPTVDMGLAQLAMHSAAETFAYADYEALLKGLTAFYQAEISATREGIKIK